MKHLKHLLTAALAMFVALVVATPAWAQTVGDQSDGTITITNASNGETYKIYKLFDAKVTGTDGGSISYTGTVPASLANYFKADSAGNIHHGKMVNGEFVADTTPVTDLTAEEIAALKAWAASASATAEAVSDGTDLVFNVQYGYYVVTTTQGETAISVTSTNPNAEIIDKNTTPPVNDLKKKSDKEEYNIGDTATYTVSFDTANYLKEEGKDPEQIVTYTITDTRAVEFLSNITVTKILVDDDANLETTNDQHPLAVQQFADNKITINWTDTPGEAGKSLYANGAKLVITYTGVVTKTAAIDGNGNTNKATITYKTDKGTEPGPDQYKTENTIYTYAVAIKKVDQKGNPLSGAKFQLPFYVEATADTDGAYVYAGTTAGTGLVNELTTPDDGLIIIKGVKSGEYSFTETEAPSGYNKLTAPVTVTATQTGQITTSTTTYLDADGNIVDTETETGSTVTVTIDKLAATPVVVVNKTGAELPSTGGIGTTIFYIVGGLMVAGAAIALLVKSRVAKIES